MLDLKLLLILIIANGAPIGARLLFGSKFDHPVDCGLRFENGKRLFGDSKSWRGIFSAIVVATIGAVALGFTWNIGMILGVWTMLGDLFSSFIKRRLGMKPSSMALGLDQIPESLFPLLAVSPILDLEWWRVLYLVLLFIVIELGLSRILFKLKIRKRPY